VPHDRIIWAWASLLFVCAAMPAQQSSSAQSQAQSKPNSAAPAHNTDLVPPSILIPPHPGISDESSSKPLTRVEAEVVHEAPSAAIEAYLNNSILPAIRANWYRLVSKSSENVGGDAAVEFTIRKDGSLVDSDLSDGAGHAVLGDLASRAVKNSAPFPALPADVTAPSLSIRARFRYEGGMASTGSFRSTSSNVRGVDEPIYPVGRGVTAPTPLFQPEPEFSEEARRKTASGIVVLKIIVTSTGDVTGIRVAKSLGSGLDEKAIEAVRQWKFKPASKDGKPVAVELAVEFDFQIKKNTH